MLINCSSSHLRLSQHLNTSMQHLSERFRPVPWISPGQYIWAFGRYLCCSRQCLGRAAPGIELVLQLLVAAHSPTPGCSALTAKQQWNSVKVASKLSSWHVSFDGSIAAARPALFPIHQKTGEWKRNAWKWFIGLAHKACSMQQYRSSK